MCGRGIELCYLEFKDVYRLEAKDGEIARYEINFERATNTGSTEASGYVSFVTGKMEVKALDDYINCFPQTARTGRFFRKLEYQSDSLTKKVMLRGNNCQVWILLDTFTISRASLLHIL